MPNWVTNILTLTQGGEQLSTANPALLKEIQEYVQGTEEGEDGETIAFDFNNIVPQPEGIYDHTSIEGITETLDGKEIQFSMPVWYNWCVENWGTKWNVSWAGKTDSGFIFDTAWSTPEPVIKALSEKFPDVEITVEFADEDVYGGNCGTYEFSAGECTGFIEGDDEFAKNLLGYPEEDEDEEEDIFDNVELNHEVGNE